LVTLPKAQVSIRPVHHRVAPVRRFCTQANQPYQKSTTGLTGLAVVPHAREILIKMYERYLSELEQFEEGTPYRAHMSKVTNWRLDVLRSTQDIFEIEEKLHLQLEQLIAQQEDEFTLVPFLLEHKPWEPRSKFDAPFVVFSNIR